MTAQLATFDGEARSKYWSLGALLILGVALIGFDVATGLGHLPVYARQHAGPIELAAALGAIAGGSELVSRYRDEPLRALRSSAGILYILMNASISACAYLLLIRYGKHILPGIAGDRLVSAIVAGFGAMAILRSKFFTLRTESGEELAVGPDAALEAFLSAANRGVDRNRAAQRLRLVFAEAEKIKHPERAKAFIETSLSAFQAVDSDESDTLNKKLDEIVREDGLSKQLQLQKICYEVLKITGEQNFGALMTNLEAYQKSQENALVAADTASKTAEQAKDSAEQYAADAKKAVDVALDHKRRAGDAARQIVTTIQNANADNGIIRNAEVAQSSVRKAAVAAKAAAAAENEIGESASEAAHVDRKSAMDVTTRALQKVQVAADLARDAAQDAETAAKLSEEAATATAANLRPAIDVVHDASTKAQAEAANATQAVEAAKDTAAVAAGASKEAADNVVTAAPDDPNPSKFSLQAASDAAAATSFAAAAAASEATMAQVLEEMKPTAEEVKAALHFLNQQDEAVRRANDAAIEAKQLANETVTTAERIANRIQEINQHSPNEPGQLDGMGGETGAIGTPSGEDAVGTSE